MPKKRSQYKEGGELPPDDHIVRHCKGSCIIPDHENNPIGITGEAFKLAVDKTTGKLEDGLSASWLEYFEEVSLVLNLDAARTSMNRNFNKGDHLAIWLINSIITTCNSFGQKIKVIYRPNADKSHSQIENILDNNLNLMREKLALETVALYHANTLAPVAPIAKAKKK